ncbi:hypothetical protein A9Q87_05760 [Flavobacteriales bacterium 34_180_T64]|nr:hypothetical protein A9Q87_05760 [Flavobacteriales bacterium 34_180_T64]
MSRVLFTTILCFISILCVGNTEELAKNITGTILDEETNQPLEFATISIYNDDALIDGIISDENGNFSIAAKRGSYLLRVEYISYVTYETQIELKQDLDLGVISLSIDVEALGEVEIIAEKSTLELKLDKKVFNVGKDILSQNGSLSQVLENVPSVAVDLDGVVSFRGNTNVTVLINGKPSVLTANNGLDQIPAQQIDRIEVISNPSSRYQAAGTAGIINVILKKNKSEGFSGSLSMSNSIRADFNTNASLNYKTNKLNVFSTIGYRFVDSKIIERVTQNSLVNGNTVILDQTIDSYRNTKMANLYFGMDYYLNEQNTITASYYKVLIDRNNRANYNYNYFDEQQVLDSIITRNETYNEPMDHNQLEINYAKTFEKEGKKLSVDFQYDFWDDDENETFVTQKTAPILLEKQLSRTRDIESSKDYLLQIDFVNPINEKSTFETGLRGETRIITSDYKAESFDGTNWNILNGIENELDYNEKIGGVYAQFSSKINKFSYQFGLRTELTKIDISDRNSEFSNTKNYTKLFPTAHFTYAFSDKTSIQLSYSRRINRPSFWHLNPFGGLAQLNSIRQGNPDMDPALTNVLELGFLTRMGKLRINPSIYFQNTDDPFQFITESNAEDVLVTKPINIDTENRIGIEISMSYNPYKWMQLSGELNYFRFEQKGVYSTVNFDFEDSRWFTRVNSRFKLPSDITLQTSFNYNGRNESAQTISKSTHSLDFGINKNFLKNKATVTFNIRNMLDSREQVSTRTGDDFSYESYRKLLGPKYSLTFTYRFNQTGKSKTRRPGESNRG